MKKTLMVLAVLGTAGLAMWGWAHAQEGGGTTDPPALPPPATFDSLYEQGKQLKVDGNYEAALPLLQQALAMNPSSEPTNILVGVCLKEQGQVREALGHFETVVAAGKGFRATALCCAAECHRALGETAEALADLKAAHEDSPIDKWGIKAVGLTAEIQGRSAAEAIAREEQAAALYRAARDRGRETHYKSPEPLAMFDQVIEQFPDTGGAGCALSQKAELLWHLGKRDEMCKTYEQLRAILRGHAGTEKLRLAYRTMDARIGEHRAEQLLRVISRALATGQEVSKEQWDRLDLLCERWRYNTDLPVRADAFLIGVLYKKGKYTELVQAGEAFFQRYFEQDPQMAFDPEYKDKLAEVHLFVGHALARLDRNQEALSQFRATVNLGNTTPPLNFGKFILPDAYFQVCRMLKALGAPQEEIAQAMEDLRSAYPASRQVKALERLQ